MGLRMLRILALCLPVVVASASVPAVAAGVDFNTPPPASVIVSQGGLEWIWAAPCAPVDPSCGKPGNPAGSFPIQGFVLPTLQQWSNSWVNRSALVSAFTGVTGGAVCGSPWLSSQYNHCDLNDLQKGHIFGATVNGICDPNYFNGCVASTTETFLVRVASVPEPGTLALLGLGLAGLGLGRRRRAT